MAMENVAAVLYGGGDLRLETWPVQTPGEGEVLVAVKAVGVCGSDVHYWKDGRIGSFVVDAPLVLGHESAGVVEAIGPGVTNLLPGDRVTIEPGVPCRVCSFCRSGRYNLCPDVVFLATPPVHGSMARYIRHAADFCYRLPDHVSLEEGAMCEPLSVGLHACRRGGVGLGSRVLITGVGTIGLVTMLAARAAGASTVVVADVREERLDLANKMGASAALSAAGPNLTADILEAAGGPLDVVVDCSGALSAIRAAMECTGPGGTVVLVGLGADEAPLPVAEIISREIDVRGVFRYANTYSAALALIASGSIDVKPMITHRFPLQDVSRAFQAAHSSRDAVKVMVTI